MELTTLSLNSGLILTGLLAVFYLSWQSPRYGIYLVAALLPAYLIRVRVFGLPTTVLELMILILFAVWLMKERRWQRIRWRWWKREKRINAIPPPFRLPLALLLISALIAALLSPNQPAAFGILKAYFLEPAMLLLVMAYEIKSPRDAEPIFYGLGATTLVVGALALWQSATGFGIPNPFWAAEATRRITTFFGYPNANSLFVAPIVAFFAAQIRPTDALTKRLFIIAVIAAGVIAVIAAKTAGALIALGIVAFVILIRNARTRMTAIALAVILVASGLHALDTSNRPRMLWDNILHNRLDLSSSSLEIRVNQWRETMALLTDKPLAGAGLSGYQQALVPYHLYQFLEIYLYPHNLFLNFWVETGILGVIAILWLLVQAVRGALEGRDHKRVGKLAEGLFYAWIVILVHGMVDVPYFKNDLSVLFMIFIGLGFIVWRARNERAGRGLRA